MVDVASRVLARVSVNDETRRAWYDLVRQHTPSPIVAYDFRLLAKCEPLTLVTDRDLARVNLAHALDDALVFAQESSLGGWAATFAEARRLLSEPSGSGLGAKLFEGALDAEAVCLLDAAWTADVFGGMASWNDVEPSAGYAEVSLALRTSIKEAVEAAINFDEESR